MMRSIILSLILSICLDTPGRADSLIMKTGEVLRGKIVDRNDKSYYMELDSGGDRVEVPVSKVSIADITSTQGKIASKGNLIVFAKAGEDLTPMPAQSEQTYRPVAQPPASHALMPAGLKSKLDILKKAEKTVADSNARAAATQKQLEEFKGIIDAANS